MWHDYYGYYPRYKPANPKKVAGGIKLQSGSKASKNWWAQRWLGALEKFTIGSRLSRGRSYARHGQVVSIEIQKGIVKAKVQGSRPKPYSITIQLKPIPEAKWDKIVEEISRQALYMAKLMAGEMPEDIEKIFAKAGLSLFPTGQNDLVTDCSCPDDANPCKHIAAVYYILGDEFSRDPFLTFKLRGMEREEFLVKLGMKSSPAKKEPAHKETSNKEPLPIHLLPFWHGEEINENFYANATPPPVTAFILKRLGNFPLWRGSEKIEDALFPVYQKTREWLTRLVF